MNNPCKYCGKANIHYVNDGEYGCDEPCQKARDFYKSVGDTLEEMLETMNKLLERTEVER